MPVVVKRVYEKAARGDGPRVLVDRLWPRGLSKATGGGGRVAARSGAFGCATQMVSCESGGMGGFS